MASTKYPCLSCGKTVTSNQNAVMCIICNEWIHLACSSLDYEFFHSDLDFFCTRCLMSELPFNNSDDESLIHDSIHVVTDHKKDPYINYENIINETSTVSGMSIAHLNVCSLLKNIEEIRVLVNKTKLDIITFCETRLDASISDNEILVDDYSIVRNDRNRNGGGVIIYVNNDVNFKVLDEYHNDLELVCIQVNLDKQKPFILLSWYRPPDSPIDVFDRL